MKTGNYSGARYPYSTRRAQARCAVCGKTKRALVHWDWHARSDYHVFVAD